MLGHRRERRQRLCFTIFALFSLASAGQPLDRATVQLAGNALELRWADAEDGLRAFVTPAAPRAGEPLTVTVRLGPIEGAPFTGPVTFSLREDGSLEGGQTVTALRAGEGWKAVLTPRTSGRHALDFTYRTTRMKTVHAAFEVTGGHVPQLVGYGALGLLAVAALAFGIRQTLRSPARR